MELSQIRKKSRDYFGQGGLEEHIFFAPGRVCLIGEHIDYNGGSVLPAALSMGIYAIFRPNNSQQIRIRSGLDDREVLVSLEEEIGFKEENGWGNYPLGVIKYLQDLGLHIKGGDLSFETNLPIGAGLSSSAAIEVLTAYLFSSLNEKGFLSNEEIALLCKDVENDFVGVQCGIMDQFAVALGKKNQAIMLDCSTLKHEYVPVNLKEHELVIFNTNKTRELSNSQFNKRTEECLEAFETIGKYKEIKSLVEAHLDDVDRFIKDPVIRKRAKHVIAENKLNLEKWLMVNFKVNRLKRMHLVDRYFNAVKSMGVKNDYKGLDYFIPSKEEVDLKSLPATHQNGYIGFVIGAIHHTKKFPTPKIIEVCKQLDQPVILLGGEAETQEGNDIASKVGEKVFNACGKYSINQSASLVKQAKKIITNDTGLMHIAAAFNKPIISLWGNTIPEFGMYPYYEQNQKDKTKIIETKDLACRPCSKLGYSHCPKNHFKCMESINEKDVVDAINLLVLNHPNDKF